VFGIVLVPIHCPHEREESLVRIRYRDEVTDEVRKARDKHQTELSFWGLSDRMSAPGHSVVSVVVKILESNEAVVCATRVIDTGH